MDSPHNRLPLSHRPYIHHSTPPSFVERPQILHKHGYHFVTSITHHHHHCTVDQGISTQHYIPAQWITDVPSLQNELQILPSSPSLYDEPWQQRICPRTRAELRIWGPAGKRSSAVSFSLMRTKARPETPSKAETRQNHLVRQSWPTDTISEQLQSHFFKGHHFLHW